MADPILSQPGRLKLELTPTNIDYAVTNGIGAQAIEYDGGSSRFGALPSQAPITVAVNWVLNGEQYLYFNQIYTLLGNGSDPFLIDLLLDTSVLTEYLAHFVPGTIDRKLNGASFTVTATLEVVQLVDPTAVSNAQALASAVTARGSL